MVGSGEVVTVVSVDSPAQAVRTASTTTSVIGRRITGQAIGLREIVA
jgi:hypothetical protein